MSAPAVCILVAGLGHRAGSRFHKGLLPVGGRAVLSHLLDRIDPESPVIVVLGHQAEQVRGYLEAAHPERKFTWVFDPDYGQGPLCSLWTAKSELQRPFILLCCDSVPESPLPLPERNWLGVCETEECDRYDTLEVADGRVLRFHRLRRRGLAFTGSAGVRDWEAFWREAAKELGRPSASLVRVFEELYPETPYSVEPHLWWDTGYPEGYERFRTHVDGKEFVLSKDADELTYRVGDRCVKVYLDTSRAQRKMQRAKVLPLMPELVYAHGPVLAYHWVPGRSPYASRRRRRHAPLWATLRTHLWRPQPESPGFRSSCWEFYVEKTLRRVRAFLQKHPELGGPLIINGTACTPVWETLAEVPWTELCQGAIPARIHGDLHYENLVLDDRWQLRALIDWRDSFGSEVELGDVYYDLGKLFSGLDTSYHAALDPSRVRWKQDSSGIQADIANERELWRVKTDFLDWCGGQGYDSIRVRLVAALVQLGIAALHPGNLGKVLFCRGLMHLDASVTQNREQKEDQDDPQDEYLKRRLEQVYGV